MAISLKHSFTSAVADEGDTSLVRPSNWNAEHTLTLATSRLLGRTTAGTGAAEEISVGTGLNLSSGSLAVSSTTPQVNSINTFTVAQVIETTDNSNPALRITQLGTADALRVEDETSPDATPFVITAAGHAIAGYGSTLTIETVVPQFQSHTATLDEGGFGGVDWGNTATGQVNWFGKSRGGSYGTQGILSSGDTIGDFRFYGSDGVGLIPAAKIEVEVDGTPGVNDMPGRISFFTTAGGASSVTERFRIGNAGQWGIGGATYGTSTQYFKSGGASAAPSWATISNTDISGLGTLATQSGTFSGTSSGTNTGDQNLFSTIAVSGQSNVVADTTSDTLTLVAGTNVTITTDATTDSITIAASSGTSSGSLIRSPQILTTGTSYTTPAGCNSIYVELVGGGGGAGGMQVTTDNVGFGSGGGGSGGYAAKYFSVSPSTAYTYAIGAGGTAGANTGTGGGNGGSTTFTVGATTVTANGGSGSDGTGANFASNYGTVGGNGGGTSNGDIGVTGNPGNAGVSSGTAGVGGNGGGSFFGGGGKGAFQSAAGDSSNGTSGSRGGGAGGSAIKTATGTASVGGQSGSAGIIRIWEYS